LSCRIRGLLYTPCVSSLSFVSYARSTHASLVPAPVFLLVPVFFTGLDGVCFLCVTCFLPLQTPGYIPLFHVGFLFHCPDGPRLPFVVFFYLASQLVSAVPAPPDFLFHTAFTSATLSIFSHVGLVGLPHVGPFFLEGVSESWSGPYRSCPFVHDELPLLVPYLFFFFTSCPLFSPSLPLPTGPGLR